MRREHDGDRKGSGRLDSVHAQRLTAFSLQPKHLSSYLIVTVREIGLVDVEARV